MRPFFLHMRITKTRLLIISGLLLANVLAFAQDTISVGDSRMKYKGAIGERKYVQYIESATGAVNFNSLLTRKIERSSGSKILISQTYQSANGIDYDSSYCTASTLEPLNYHTYIKSEGHREHVTFHDDKIANVTFFKDSSQTIVKENVGYFNGVMTDELIAALPLKEGASFVFKTVNPGLRFYPYVTRIVVVGKELLKIAGQDFPCWRIRVNQGGPSDAMEWYTVKDRIQVMKKFPLGNGSIFYRVLISH